MVSLSNLTIVCSFYLVVESAPPVRQVRHSINPADSINKEESLL